MPSPTATRFARSSSAAPRTNDGRAGRFLIAPAEPAQEDLLARAYQDAGVDPGCVDYLETHGAGTNAADPE